MSLSFAVLGSGSIGTYIGCRLSAAGNVVTLYGRERIRNELKTFGAKITDYTNKEIFLPPSSISFSYLPFERLRRRRFFSYRKVQGH
ncbi:ketopantoate reductase PanE/ApbA domain protein [Leptospira alexanderi serovar Manhao 3 str. L 60]|uniref:Ketopantoate reductase PanE/ApbA domain protein n=1 Tax=Leptospira alexanderi serovar Manhao 3 str. L 60 TaxID=1049759 RepID=V6I009_9LEPT|nr:ketopantoate reductase PanE/ApbA domain protein [Leptospira alexanderi serovar Manhao 3 str. L 60]